MARHRMLSIILALAATLALAAPALAGPGGELRAEPGWYNGQRITIFQPSLFSANPNGGVLGCFGLGPDLSAIQRPVATLYAIFDSTATDDHCDGQPDQFRHQHVVSAVPGSRGYSGAWQLILLVEAVPGSRDLGTAPFTSVADVQAAIAAGTLVDITAAFAPDGVTFIAPVIGRG